MTEPPPQVRPLAATELPALDRRVHAAHGDAWQAQGRLRVAHGGGVAALPGVRLMSSGLPAAQWNGGDVDDPARLDLPAVAAWYAGSAFGRGVPWGLRLPAGTLVPAGRRLLRQACMALQPGAFLAPGQADAACTIRPATPADLDLVAALDAGSFGGAAAPLRAWLAPQLGAAGFSVALAFCDDRPAGVATAVRTDERAGACVGVFGVGVLPWARRRGVATTLTGWLLVRAFADGAQLAHLNPVTEAAERLYARLGFSATTGIDVVVAL